MEAKALVEHYNMRLIIKHFETGNREKKDVYLIAKCRYIYIGRLDTLDVYGYPITRRPMRT